MKRALSFSFLLMLSLSGPLRAGPAPAPYFDAGRQAEAAGKWEEAYKAYVKSVESGEPVSTNETKRAISYAFLVATEHLGWFDEALALTEQHLSSHRDGYLCRMRGDFYWKKLRDYEKARKEYRRGYEDFMATPYRLYEALYTLHKEADCYLGELHEMEYYTNRKHRNSYTREAHRILLEGYAQIDGIPDEWSQGQMRWHYQKTLRDIYKTSWYSGKDPELAEEYDRIIAAYEEELKRGESKSSFELCHAEYSKLWDDKKWAEAAQLWEDYAKRWPSSTNSLNFVKRLAKLYRWAEDWENALRVGKYAIDLIEKDMGRMTTDIEKAVALERSAIANYEWALVPALKLERYDEVFEIMERSHARAMLDLLGNRDYSRQEARLSADERELLLMKTRIDEIKDAIAKERTLGRPEEVASLQRSLVLVEDTSSKIQRRADIARREILTPRQVKPVSAQEAQQLIGEDTLICTFEGIYETVITKDVIISREMRGHSFFEKLIGDYRNAIERQGARSRALVLQADGEIPPAADNELLEISQRLYDYIIRPVEKYFSKTSDRIYIVYDRQHPRIPYQVLHDGQHYLAEKYTLVYAPSMSVLKKCMERRHPLGQKLVALGNPDLGNPNFNLAYAEDEVKKLAEIYPDSRILTGSEASEAAVQLLAPDADILHLACHGVIDEDDPMKSHLRLAPDKDNDGYLTADEIMDLNLQCSLVTLSACDTGRGRILMGGDILGLTRAWIYAGTPSVLASLWKVDDRATSQLMTAFYENLKTHDKAKALQLAQLDMIKQGLSPFYWAAFCLYGDYQ